MFSKNSVQDLSDKNKKIIVIMIMIVFWIWSFPDNTLLQTQGGLDSSWVIGIHMAQKQNFVWGTDIIFTLGPLGYLLYPINIDNELWIQSVSYTIFLHTLFFSLLSFFILKTKKPIKNAIIFGFFLITFLKYPPIYAPLLGMLIGFFVYLEIYKKKMLIIPLAFFTAFLMYTKVDLGIGALSILFFSCLYLIIKKRWDESIILFGSYSSFLIFIWLVLGYPLNDLQNYFSTSLEMASGWSSVFGIDVIPGIFIVFPIFAGVLIFCWSLEFLKNNKSNLTFIFLAPVPIFFFFKMGFVRADPGHVLYSFLLFSGFFLILTFLDENDKNKPLRYITYVFVILIILTGVVALNAGQVYMNTQSFDISKSLDRSLNMLKNFYFNSQLTKFIQEISYFDDESYSSIREEQKQKIRERFPITENTTNLFMNKTVDIIPWEISIPYAYELNWHPRPIFQQTTTSNQDNINSKFFETKTSPQFVIYEKIAIDKRFPIFEDPASLRNLICNYNIIKYEKPFLIFEKNEKNLCKKETIISKQEIRFNETVFVPHSNLGYTFAKINVEQNWLGKLSSYLYKPPQIFIKLNEEEVYRFTYPLASNGILLSSSQETKNECSLILDDITSLEIISEYQNIDPSQQFSGDKFFLGSPEQYFEDMIKIEFVNINASMNSMPKC